jgi:hypothetical protein
VFNLRLFPEGFPVGAGLIDFHFPLQNYRLASLKKGAKVGFFLIRNPICRRFGTFVGGKLVIIYTVEATMKG